MKLENISVLADRLGVSKSLVSRTVRHCPGVDSDIRRRILSVAKDYAAPSGDRCAIYSILPDTPTHFWGPIRSALSLCRRDDVAPMKCNVYTHLQDDDCILMYLDEAEAMDARVILIAAGITPAIRQRLMRLREKRLILLLSEYSAVPNCFYIGADAYGDGARMADAYLTLPTETVPLILTIEGNENVSLRVRGFVDRIHGLRPACQPVTIPLEKEISRQVKIRPSHIARLLSEATVGISAPLCVYTPLGLSRLPLAIHKARLSDRCICLCHDCKAEDDVPVPVLMTCRQDIAIQSVRAMDMAILYATTGEYPEQKNIFIPSIFTS